jgi:hypothetical protein
MVNVYGNPVDPNAPPATLLQADQQNVIGNANRERVGLPYWQQTQPQQQTVQQPTRPGFPAGYVGGVLLPNGDIMGGHPSEAAMEADRQRQGVYTYNRNQYQMMQQGQPQRYAEQAQQEAEQRARYTNPDNLGDSRTQGIINATRMMRMIGFDVADEDTMMGRTLEAQRQGALQTPDTRDERFYENERDKWNANAIERSGAYHSMGMRMGVPIPANPFENRGDVALALEKGGNGKDFTPATYGFNPNVGSMLGILPMGKGFQESEWDTAVARYKGKAAPAPVSFMDAINYQAAQQGRMGVYGNLLGGVKDTEPNVPVRTQPFLGIFDEGSVKKPFISNNPQVQMSYEKPTGELDFFGLKAIVPGLAFFQEGKAIATRTTTSNLPETTRITGRASSLLPNGTIMESTFFETSGGKKTDTTTTVTPTPSGYDIFNQNIRNTLHLPPPEVGERAVQFASMFNPLTTVPTVASIFAEKFNPSALPFTRAMEPMRGQYTEFYENPVLKPITMAAVGFGAGSLFKGAESIAGAGRAAAAEKIISNGGLWRAAATTTDVTSRYTPKILTGLYGVDIAGRSTKWGTDFNPDTVSSKAKGILIQEAVPMGIGFSAGQRAPSAIYNRAKISDINFKSAVQEGTASNRIDYYVKQPVGRAVDVMNNPIQRMKLEIPQFIEESGGSTPKGVAAYGSYKVGNAYRANVDIPIKSFLQEGFRSPKGSGAAPAITEKITPFNSGTPANRIGTKIVGGKTVTSLAREPSMKSMGIGERSFDIGSGKKSGYGIGKSTDFRGKQSSTMKPMKESSYGYQGKQASGQMLLLREELSMPTTSARVAPQNMQTPYSIFETSPKRIGAVSIMEPELEFSQTSRTRQYFSRQENPILANIAMLGLGQGVKTTSMTSVQQRARQGQSLSLFSELQSTTPRKTQQQVRNTISQRDSIYGFDLARVTATGQSTRQGTRQSSWLDEIQGFKTSSLQRTGQDQTQKSWIDKTTKPTTTTVPVTGILPFFPSGGAGGVFGGRKGKLSWREKIPLQSMLFAKPRKITRKSADPFSFDELPTKKTKKRAKGFW